MGVPPHDPTLAGVLHRPWWLLPPVRDFRFAKGHAAGLPIVAWAPASYGFTSFESPAVIAVIAS